MIVFFETEEYVHLLKPSSSLQDSMDSLQA